MKKFPRRRVVVASTAAALALSIGLGAAACSPSADYSDQKAAPAPSQSASVGAPVKGSFSSGPIGVMPPEPPSASPKPSLEISDGIGDLAPVYVAGIALATNGPIACGDSAEVVSLPLHKARETDNAVKEDAVKVALEALFAFDSFEVAALGDDLVNPLYRSDLTIAEIRPMMPISTYEVWLEGDAIAAGVCDGPRLLAQIEETVRANAAKGAVAEVYLNGKPFMGQVIEDTEDREPKKTTAPTAGKAAVESPARLVSLTNSPAPADPPSSKAKEGPALGGETAANGAPVADSSVSVESESTPVEDCSLTSSQVSTPTKFGHIAFEASGCDEGWSLAWFEGAATTEAAGTVICSPALAGPSGTAPGCVVAVDGVWSLVSGDDLDGALSKVVAR